MLNKLQTMLKPMVRKKVISVWEDTKISAGDEWRGQIKEALTRAKAAVLLVSPYFLLILSPSTNYHRFWTRNDAL